MAKKKHTYARALRKRKVARRQTIDNLRQREADAVAEPRATSRARKPARVRVKAAPEVVETAPETAPKAKKPKEPKEPKEPKAPKEKPPAE